MLYQIGAIITCAVGFAALVAQIAANISLCFGDDEDESE